MSALKFARGDAALLKQGLRRCRPWCFGDHVTTKSSLPAASSGVWTTSYYSHNNRTLITRCSPLWIREQSRVRVATATPTLSVSHRHINSTSSSRAPPGAGHLDTSMTTPEWRDRMLTSMRHTLSELQAKISQQDEHEQQCFGLQLSTGYGVMDSAPNGVAGGMNLPLAAGRWAGMNASTLHAEMHAHMDNIARFAMLPKQNSKQDVGRFKKKTGIQAVDNAKSGKDGDADLDNVDIRRLSMWGKVQYFKNKIKQLYKRYFWVAFGTYWVLYGGGFVVIFGALYTGLVDPGVDLPAFIQSVVATVGMDQNETAQGYVENIKTFLRSKPENEQLMLAFVFNEIIEIPREVLVVFITPSIARALGKAPPKKPKGPPSQA